MRSAAQGEAEVEDEIRDGLGRGNELAGGSSRVAPAPRAACTGCGCHEQFWLVAILVVPERGVWSTATDWNAIRPGVIRQAGRRRGRSDTKLRNGAGPLGLLGMGWRARQSMCTGPGRRVLRGLPGRLRAGNFWHETRTPSPVSGPGVRAPWPACRLTVGIPLPVEVHGHRAAALAAIWSMGRRSNTARGGRYAAVDLADGWHVVI